MTADDSLFEVMLAEELDDRPVCGRCLDRPKRWLGRFHNRLWICANGHAWRTKPGRHEAVTWLWRRWPA